MHGEQLLRRSLTSKAPPLALLLPGRLMRNLRPIVRAPDIVEAVLTGKQPVDLTANRLANTPEIPVDWAAKRKLILGADGDWLWSELDHR